MSGPLTGVTVIELGEWVAAPYAAKILGDLGAGVTKVEWGGGDPMRRAGPFPEGADGDPERSAEFAYLNTSKASWWLPADTSPEELSRLVCTHGSDADVVVVDQHFLRRLPDTFLETFTEWNPATVLSVVTPFGLSGPRGGWRGHDLNVSASSGCSYGVGEKARAPLPVPMSQAEHQAGLVLAIATLMAVQARHRDGLGQLVEVASTEALASLHTAFFLPLFVYGGGTVGCRNGREGALPTYPNTVLPCSDGLIALNSPQVAQWIRFIELMGKPAWSAEPRYRDRRAMAWEYKDEVDALVVDWLQHRSKDELYQAFIERRIPSAPVMTGTDLLRNDHLAARGAVVPIDLPGGGALRAPAPPYKFSRSKIDVRPAPRLGNAIAPQDSADRASVRADVPDLRSPLADLRVLDLGTAWAGGLAGRFLADFGADVIKVESWTHMDGSRKGRPIGVDDVAGGDEGHWPDMQPGFHVHSRSKRSIAVNLKTDEGRELLLRLAASADLLIHNFSAGVMERLDLAPDTLLEVNPRLIVAGQSVAGQSGPASRYIGYAGAVAALGGIGGVIGYEDEDPIGMFHGLHSDVISALTTVVAALAALEERHGSDRGQAVEVSQWEATMAMAAGVILHADVTGEDRGSVGFEHPLLHPHRTYPCRVDPGDDPTTAWVSIAVAEQQEWHALLEVIGADGLPGDAHQWTIDDRRQHSDAIDEAIAAWTGQHDRYGAEAVLQGAGVAAAAVQNVADMLADPHLAHRESFVYLEHPRIGVEPMPGLPWRLHRTEGAIAGPAPDLGAHTHEVLVDELGMSESEYERLVDAGVIETGPVPTTTPETERRTP